MAGWRSCIVGLIVLLSGCADVAYLDLFRPEPPAARYTFTGLGTEVRDSVADAHGRAFGGALLNGGGLTLDGSDDYVELPAAVPAMLDDDFTVVAWIEWYGGPCGQRVFEIGSGEGAAGRPSVERRALFMTPASCSEGAYAVKSDGGRESLSLSGKLALPIGRLVHVALTVERTREHAALFVEGWHVDSSAAPPRFDQLDDVSLWLGRSHGEFEPFARLRYEELRIYDRALNADEIRYLRRSGPNAL